MISMEEATSIIKKILDDDTKCIECAVGKRFYVFTCVPKDVDLDDYILSSFPSIEKESGKIGFLSSVYLNIENPSELENAKIYKIRK